MLSPFDALFDKRPKPEEVEGVFQCSKCYQDTHKANYNKEEQLLYWNCSSCGKYDFMEGMDL